MTAPRRAAAVRCERLSVAFNGVEVLHDFTLDVAPGEFVMLLGPSGCGKSTILRVLAGLVAPVEGFALVGGVPVAGPSAERAMMFQEDALLPWRSALANVAFPLESQPIARRERLDRARKLLRQVGLRGSRTTFPASCRVACGNESSSPACSPRSPACC